MSTGPNRRGTPAPETAQHDPAAEREALLEAIVTAPVMAIPPETKIDFIRDDGRREYTVTALAGPRVAGHRLEPGATSLWLTEPEARDELLSGTIVPAGEAPHAMFTRDDAPAAVGTPPEAAS